MSYCSVAHTIPYLMNAHLYKAEQANKQTYHNKLCVYFHKLYLSDVLSLWSSKRPLEHCLNRWRPVCGQESLPDTSVKPIMMYHVQLCMPNLKHTYTYTNILTNTLPFKKYTQVYTYTHTQTCIQKHSLTQHSHSQKKIR